MAEPYRAAAAILLLLQLASIILLSVGSFRMRHWLTPQFRQLPFEEPGGADSRPIRGAQLALLVKAPSTLRHRRLGLGLRRGPLGHQPRNG